MKMKTRNNWTMRAAGMMLALVLITSSFVGGTFAKYTTSGTGRDSARVAKFGVTITADADEMFKRQYETKSGSSSTSITYSVDSSDRRNDLVAPGTKCENAMTFSLKGQPEVAVNVNVDIHGYDVFLKKSDNLKDVTTADPFATFQLAEDYYPVVFTLYKNGAKVDSVKKISDIQTYFAGVSGNYPANSNLDDLLGVYTISWEWEFDGNDKADTLLGYLTNKRSGFGLEMGSDKDYQSGLHFILIATVTQID